MNLYHLIRLFAALAFSLPIIACAAPNEEAINLDPILGRWYPNTNGPSPFLDISQDKFVFEGAVTYKTTLIGESKGPDGYSALAFKVTDINRITEYGYGCGTPATYIEVSIIPSDDSTIMLMGDVILVYFFRGDAVLTEDGIYDLTDACIGNPFRRKEKVGYSPL
jgi:hypothetical protein